MVGREWQRVLLQIQGSRIRAQDRPFYRQGFWSWNYFNSLSPFKTDSSYWWNVCVFEKSRRQSGKIHIAESACRYGLHLWKYFCFFFVCLFCFVFFWGGGRGIEGSLRPVKIISLILSRADCKVGRKLEIPEKNHLDTRKQNLACLAYDPSEARTHGGEMTSDLERLRWAALTTRPRGPSTEMFESHLIKWKSTYKAKLHIFNFATWTYIPSVVFLPWCKMSVSTCLDLW